MIMARGSTCPNWEDGGVVDPLAEVYSSYSPYQMVAGNPITNLELDGRSFETAIGSPMNDIRSMHPIYIRVGSMWMV